MEPFFEVLETSVPALAMDATVDATSVNCAIEQIPVMEGYVEASQMEGDQLFTLDAVSSMVSP